MDELKVYQKILLGLGGVLLLIGGLLITKDLLFDDPKVEILQATPTVLSAAAEKRVVVDVSGAVVSPGVYLLDSDSRVGAALSAAGGLSGNADRGWVAKNINLAGKLTDGGKIYIPRAGEVIGRESATGGGGQGTGINEGGAVNINTASATELDTLPGVGPVTANKIITNRPYSGTEELVAKKVVSQKVFDGLKDRISVY